MRALWKSIALWFQNPNAERCESCEQENKWQIANTLSHDQIQFATASDRVEICLFFLIKEIAWVRASLPEYILPIFIS